MTASDSPFVDALGRLTAPGHKDEFYDDLWRRIEREVGPQSESSPAPARAGRRAPSRRLRFAILTAAAAAAAVLVTVVALNGLPGVQSTQPEPATAASVGAGIGRAMQSWRTFEAIMYLRSDMASGYPSDPATARIRVTLSSDGGERWDWLSAAGPQEYRQLDPQQGDAEAYDPQTHEDQIYQAHGGEDGRPSLLILRNAFPASFGPLQPYAAAARAMLAEQDPDAPVERTVVDGRPAWRLEFGQPGDDWAPSGLRPSDLECGMTVSRGFGVSSRIVVTVDAATGLPLRIVGRDGKGRIVGEMRLRRVVVDGALPPDAFRLPAGKARVGGVVGETRAVSLSRVESIIGRPPLVPSRVPAGYSLATACIVPDYNGEPAVELFYRRGLDLFVIAEAPAGFDADLGGGLFFQFSLRERVSQLEDTLPGKLSAAEREAVHERRGILRGGELAGRPVSTAISALWAPGPWRGPSLWTTDSWRSRPQLIVTGTLSRAELMDVAESLEPWTE
jgi:hypothetical protein